MQKQSKVYKTAQTYIDAVNKEARELELLESLLREKYAKIEKSLAVLRAYKRRGIVNKISKYNYEINR